MVAENLRLTPKSFSMNTPSTPSATPSRTSINSVLEKEHVQQSEAALASDTDDTAQDGPTTSTWTDREKTSGDPSGNNTMSRVASGTASMRRSETRDDGSEYPMGVKLFLIVLALCLAVFLMCLDNTIIATAIPKITDEFNSLDDLGWYASGM